MILSGLIPTNARRLGRFQKLGDEREKLLFAADDTVELVEVAFETREVNLLPEIRLALHQQQTSIGNDVGYK